MTQMGRRRTANVKWCPADLLTEIVWLLASYQHKQCKVNLGFTNPSMSTTHPLSTSSQTMDGLVKPNLILAHHGMPNKGTGGEGPA